MVIGICPIHTCAHAQTKTTHAHSHSMRTYIHNYTHASTTSHSDTHVCTHKHLTHDYYTCCMCCSVPDPVGHSLDMSEFPVLGARSRPDSSSSLSNAIGIPGILPSRHGYGTGMLFYFMPNNSLVLTQSCVQ